MQKVLILGSGALQIGQAGEFDYSGSQAVKALKEEGKRVVLVNPNIATIQTSRGLADTVYFLPLNASFVTKVIEKEKPQGIMLAFGGQSALNCGVELERRRVLQKNGVEVLGTPLGTVKKTEDRELFRRAMQSLNLPIPHSFAITSIEELREVAKKIKFPVMMRSAYALGGLGSAVVYTYKQLVLKLELAFRYSPQILIEEYLEGWKEIEYEVVRDRDGNKITVCNMENMDPMGIHTGESIVVAPSQTLTNDEYFKLRRASLACIEGLGVVGECNIQFAVNPDEFDYRIIEVNARLSRSSALASKATGYPLASVAAKLALGCRLYEIKNAVTEKTSAFFEPALDYLVIKIPRWDLSKFSQVDEHIGSEMKSVGEVMSIGRSFPEAIQKAARMLDIGYLGIIPIEVRKVDYKKELSNPTPERPFLIVRALLDGFSVEKIYQLTKIDRWFIYQLQEITKCYKELKGAKRISKDIIYKAKKMGFSDAMLAHIFVKKEEDIRRYRLKHEIKPVVNKIDTLAGEFPAETNYLYLTYHGDKHDSLTPGDSFHKMPGVGILGGGPYRIGSSVEFDWCAVNTAWEFNKRDYQTVMINCNPETVSTDYDMSDRLYFEELTFERLLDIVEVEEIPLVICMGGQTPNNLALPLKKAGVKILGTDPFNIDQAEDRKKFSRLLDRINIKQPFWFDVYNSVEARIKAKILEFPVLIRPSYVLSGQAMFVAYNESELNTYLKHNSKRGVHYPLTMSKYFEEAMEVDVDGVACKGNVISCILLEHVEHAGVHSGDATLVYPPYRLKKNAQIDLIRKTKTIAQKLKINGPFNIQYLLKEGQAKVIECNLRSSRSFPFSAKVTGVSLIGMVVDAMLSDLKPSSKLSFKENPKRIALNKSSAFIKPVLSTEHPFAAVKVPQFSFTRLRGADPILRVEMASTGEVACFGTNLHEAYLKAVLSTGVKLPQKAVLLSLGGYHAKRKFLTHVHLLDKLGFELYATKGTHEFLKENGLAVICVYKISEVKRRPTKRTLSSEQGIDVKTAIVEGMVDFVVNTSEKPDVGLETFREQVTDGYIIRRAAIDYDVPLMTNLESAKLFVEALAYMQRRDFEIEPWDKYVNIKSKVPARGWFLPVRQAGTSGGKTQN